MNSNELSVKSAIALVVTFGAIWWLGSSAWGLNVLAFTFHSVAKLIGLAILITILYQIHKFMVEAGSSSRTTAIVCSILVMLYLGHQFMSYQLRPIRDEFHSSIYGALEVVQERNQFLKHRGFIILGKWSDDWGCGPAFYLWCPPLAWMNCYPKPYNYLHGHNYPP